MLSAVVAVLCRAKQLVILSDINGFYDSDPRLHPAASLDIANGTDTIITNGKNPEAVYDIIRGSQVGTQFVGKAG